ncbi:hypothetical protein AMECASPLE_009663 [Ameca splendens]|uniref:Uncharacterized protein n=1 Tax=Ameca splendens TaxID=208324 RepID=A0ABV0YMK9_9TELE
MGGKWYTEELVLISSSLQARGGVHPGQVASPSQGNTETINWTVGGSQSTRRKEKAFWSETPRIGVPPKSGGPGRTTKQQQCRSSRELQQLAHRPHRQLALPEQIWLWTRDPRAHHPPAGPDITRGARPSQADTWSEKAHTQVPTPGH